MGTMRERPVELGLPILTSAQTQQMRDMARACGADADFLLRVVRESRVTIQNGHVSLSNSIPSSTTGQMRAVDLAFSILRHAYEGPRGPRQIADFGSASLGAAAHDYFRTSFTSGPETTVFSDRTSTWLRRQAERFGMDFNMLSGAIRTYSSLIESNPTIAAQALKYAAGVDARIEAFAIAFTERAQVRQRGENGNTELYIRNVDTGPMLAQYRRDIGEDIHSARIRRSA